MQPFRGLITGLPLVLLTACATSQPGVPTADFEHPGVGRLLTRGDIQVAEMRLRDFGYEPGPIDGVFTAQTQAAVRAFQARYGIPVAGLLDRETRIELLPGLDIGEIEPD